MFVYKNVRNSKLCKSVYTRAKKYLKQTASYIGLTCQKEQKHDCVHVDHNQCHPFTIFMYTYTVALWLRKHSMILKAVQH